MSLVPIHSRKPIYQHKIFALSRYRIGENSFCIRKVYTHTYEELESAPVGQRRKQRITSNMSWHLMDASAVPVEREIFIEPGSDLNPIQQAKLEQDKYPVTGIE